MQIAERGTPADQEFHPAILNLITCLNEPIKKSQTVIDCLMQVVRTENLHQKIPLGVLKSVTGDVKIVELGHRDLSVVFIVIDANIDHFRSLGLQGQSKLAVSLKTKRKWLKSVSDSVFAKSIRLRHDL